MFENIQVRIEGELNSLLSDREIPLPESWGWKPIPFSGEWGISTSFFKAAAAEAREGKAVKVPVRAQELAELAAEALRDREDFSRVEAVRGYLNLFFHTDRVSQRVIDQVLEQGEDFGRGYDKDHQVMVEFSQPNTHKAFHVGHLRSAILGDVICRILDFAGYDVVRANYYGDIGLHVIKWLWNYRKHHAGEKPARDTTRWMGELYAEANQRLEEQPELEQEVRELYARWDRRDPEIVKLWEETRSWSLEGFEDLYQTLDIQFDRFYSNSEVEQPGKELVRELIEKNIAEDLRPDDAVIVKIDELLGLEEEKYRVLVVLRSDGTALYSTEDLALAKIKFQEYDLDRSIYVVDVRQSLHFQQVWKTLEIAGYEWAEDCQHLAYELVNLPGNVVMASREGTVVLLEDLIKEAQARALEVVEEKNPDLADQTKEDVARAVGLGAIKFPMLDRDNTRIVTFDWETALDFNGQAAPYIQYAHVRANSILAKLGGELPGAVLPGHELQEEEIELIETLSRVPGELAAAARDLKTLPVSRAAFQLAQSFNAFYRSCPVLDADPGVKHFRLRIVAAVRQTLANLLGVLGIEAPDVM
jgi:arginyl-tRNA synthetase